MSIAEKDRCDRPRLCIILYICTVIIFCIIMLYVLCATFAVRRAFAARGIALMTLRYSLGAVITCKSPGPKSANFLVVVPSIETPLK